MLCVQENRVTIFPMKFAIADIELCHFCQNETVISDRFMKQYACEAFNKSLLFPERIRIAQGGCDMFVWNNQRRVNLSQLDREAADSTNELMQNCAIVLRRQLPPEALISR